MSCAVLFKDLRCMREFMDIDGNLFAVFVDFLQRCWPDNGTAARVRSIARTLEENEAAGAKTMIHVIGPPWRAIDIGAKEFTPAQVAEATKRINALWVYDPSRPDKQVCFSEPHGDGPHFHLQSHPTTRKR